MSSLTEYVETLDCADDAERIYAAEDIGYLKSNRQACRHFWSCLRKEPSRAVRDAIFLALTRIDAEAATEASIGLLASDDPQIRNQAVEVLRHKGAAAIPFLASVMRQGDKDLRKLVLDVLSGVQTKGADAIYEAALSDPDVNVIITAVENLGKTREKQFRCRLEDLLLADSPP